MTELPRARRLRLLCLLGLALGCAAAAAQNLPGKLPATSATNSASSSAPAAATATATATATAALTARTAAAVAPAVANLAIEATTLQGQPFSLAALKGKVVLVLWWSTACAVCRDKMPELRQNQEGWLGKPFELVLVNVDAQLADLQAYEAIISRTVPLRQRFVQLWAGAAGYRDTVGKPAQLPLAYLLGKDGKVVERYTGRIPPEAWDRIAELL